MSDIDTALTQIETELDAARSEAATIDTTGAALAARQEAIQSAITDLQKARDNAEGLKLAIGARNSAAMDLVGNYFGAIDPVRQAVSTGGALAPAAQANQKCGKPSNWSSS